MEISKKFCFLDGVFNVVAITIHEAFGFFHIVQPKARGLINRRFTTDDDVKYVPIKSIALQKLWRNRQAHSRWEKGTSGFTARSSEGLRFECCFAVASSGKLVDRFFIGGPRSTGARPLQ